MCLRGTLLPPSHAAWITWGIPPTPSLTLLCAKESWLAVTPAIMRHKLTGSHFMEGTALLQNTPQTDTLPLLRGKSNSSISLGRKNWWKCQPPVAIWCEWGHYKYRFYNCHSRSWPWDVWHMVMIITCPHLNHIYSFTHSFIHSCTQQIRGYFLRSMYLQEVQRGPRSKQNMVLVIENIFKQETWAHKYDYNATRQGQLARESDKKYCQAEHNGSHSQSLRESGKVSQVKWNRMWFLKDKGIHVDWVGKSFLAWAIAGAEEGSIKGHGLQSSVAGVWDKQVRVTGDGIRQASVEHSVQGPWPSHVVNV